MAWQGFYHHRCSPGYVNDFPFIGIFGMSSFVAEQRRKEIGVRKVLGASVVGVWALLSREFITLVLISLALASSAAWDLSS
jgi:ABC-type antimicrobial peptide transport system permease subunit